MSKWKFGDVIRRDVDEGPHDERALAMVVTETKRNEYIGIGLRDKGATGYHTGKIDAPILAEYWTLVTDE